MTTISTQPTVFTKKILFRFCKNYADFKEKKELVSTHPSLIFEDSKNYFIIHLTTTNEEKLDGVDVLRNSDGTPYVFLVKDTVYNGGFVNSHNCYIARGIAVIGKKQQEQLKTSKPKKCFSIGKPFTFSNEEELLEVLYNEFSKLIFYNGYYKRSDSNLGRDLSREAKEIKDIILSCRNGYI